MVKEENLLVTAVKYTNFVNDWEIVSNHEAMHYLNLK